MTRKNLIEHRKDIEEMQDFIGWGSGFAVKK